MTVFDSVPKVSNLCKVCGSLAENLSCASCGMALCAVCTTSELEDTGEKGTWDCVCSPTYFQQIRARLEQPKRTLEPGDVGRPHLPVSSGFGRPCKGCSKPTATLPCTGCEVVYCAACIAEGSDCSCNPSYMLQVMLGVEAQPQGSPLRGGVPSSSASSWQDNPSLGSRERHAGGYTDAQAQATTDAASAASTAAALAAIARTLHNAQDPALAKKGKLGSIGRSDELLLFLARGCGFTSVTLCEGVVGREALSPSSKRLAMPDLG